MSALNLDGFDTQLAPMTAIVELMNDWRDGHTTHQETLALINAVCEEWAS